MKIQPVTALSVLIAVIFLSASTFAEEESSVFGNFDIFSLGSEYWGKMKAGLSFDIYDDGALVSETILQENPDIKLNITELIKKYGFPVETHTVFTEDDYVLTLHRIPRGRRVRKNESYLNEVDTESNETIISGANREGERNRRRVVLLHHGLCSSSVDWIMNTADKALPYMLAEAGYDVWLANARGNRYSQRHIAMTSKKSKFWDFSWHEIGKYDLPIVIDYILNLTGQNDLDYVGHSMGTTAFFVAMSLNPEYNEKIRSMVAMGPAVFMEDMKSPLRYLSRFSTWEKYIYDLLGNGEIIPDYILKYMHQFAPSVCSETDSVAAEICDNIMYMIGGYNPEQVNETQMPVILSHTPSSCSSKCGIHFLQSVNSQQFRQYDYGYIGNFNKYGSFNPPEYDLKNVTVPIFIFWAENDVLCDPKGIRRLEKSLPNLVESIRVPDANFTHVDYLFAKDADILVYKKVLELLELPRLPRKEVLMEPLTLDTDE